ncbi:hypothetical protein ACS0TY_004828 [Phlomoides rotata]
MCFFFSGLDDGSKLHLNACSGGAFYELSTERCTKILDGIANNSSDFDVRRGQAQSVAQVGSNDLMQTLMMTLLDKCLNLKDGACDGDTWETTDGEFPQLQYLRISGSDLQHWITEDDPFPRLMCLVLYRCPYLNEIPDSIGEIPTLDQIKVDVLNRSLMKSAKEIQRVQREYGNEAIQAYCIHMMR